MYAAGTKEVYKEHMRRVQSLLSKMGASPSSKPKELSSAVEKLYELNKNPIEVTNGLLWEVEEVVTKQTPNKLILVVPINIESYESFRLSTIKLFSQPLPEAKKSWFKNINDESNILGFIHFDSDWKPYFVKVRKPGFIESIKNLDAEKIDLKEALTKAFRI